MNRDAGFRLEGRKPEVNVYLDERDAQRVTADSEKTGPHIVRKYVREMPGSDNFKRTDETFGPYPTLAEAAKQANRLGIEKRDLHFVCEPDKKRPYQ